MGNLVFGDFWYALTRLNEGQSLINHKPVTRIAELLPPYNRSLNIHIKLVDVLRSHSVTFEESRDAINKWVEQAELEDIGWKAAWEDICEVEVEHWK